MLWWLACWGVPCPTSPSLLSHGHMQGPSSRRSLPPIKPGVCCFDTAAPPPAAWRQKPAGPASKQLLQPAHASTAWGGAAYTCMLYAVQDSPPPKPRSGCPCSCRQAPRSLGAPKQPNKEALWGAMLAAQMGLHAGSPQAPVPPSRQNQVAHACCSAQTQTRCLQMQLCRTNQCSNAASKQTRAHLLPLGLRLSLQH
jgi:hypothetical protein